MAIKDLGKYQKAGMKLLDKEVNEALDITARSLYTICENKATFAKAGAGAWLLKEGVEEDSTILTVGGLGMLSWAALGIGKVKKDFKNWDVDEFIEDIPETEKK